MPRRRKTLRKNPSTTVLIAGGAAALVAVAGGAWWFWRRSAQQKALKEAMSKRKLLPAKSVQQVANTARKTEPEVPVYVPPTAVGVMPPTAPGTQSTYFYDPPTL